MNRNVKKYTALSIFEQFSYPNIINLNKEIPDNAIMGLEKYNYKGQKKKNIWEKIKDILTN